MGTERDPQEADGLLLDEKAARARRLEQLVEALECGEIRGREQLEDSDIALLRESMGDGWETAFDHDE